MAVKIKICGITDAEDALLCVSEGADALGFIFYRQSPRFILPKAARRIIDQLPCFISKVGVFVDEDESAVRETAQIAGVDTLQFHGKESPAYCRKFSKNYKVIKAFFPGKKDILSVISRYKTDTCLLDIPFKEKSSCAVLDLRIADKIKNQVKFLILSGGLTPQNVNTLVKRVKPYAVDIARGVERLPGKKDARLIREFIKQVRRVK